MDHESLVGHYSCANACLSFILGHVNKKPIIKVVETANLLATHLQLG